MQFFADYDDAGSVREITVDAFDDEITISPLVLSGSIPDFLQRHGDEFTITVTNGQATYRIVGTDEGGWIRAVRVAEQEVTS